MSEASSTELVRSRLSAGAALLDSMLAGECVEEIGKAAEVVAKAIRGGNKLLLFGNGGSAADAVHIAAEFVGRYLIERQPLPAVALTANLSAVTAIGNDYGYEEIFARQVGALGVAGDVAVGMSTSGRSANVVRGLRCANQEGLATIAMTGADPGPVGGESDLCIRIPSMDTPRVQEGHTIAAHIVCEWVEAQLAEGRASS
jgi:D-sedoheptulose 7-phosphate isomerase